REHNRMDFDFMMLNKYLLLFYLSPLPQKSLNILLSLRRAYACQTESTAPQKSGGRGKLPRSGGYAKHRTVVLRGTAKLD
ncbi:MAG: hypothetical protein AABY26_00650, partial [Nanoarchaeota archaeon]